MKPADIAINKVYTNGKNRFRVVTELRKDCGEWVDVHYADAYRNTKGVMRRVVPTVSFTHSGIHSFAGWCVSEATPGDAAEVLSVLNIKETQ